MTENHAAPSNNKENAGSMGSSPDRKTPPTAAPTVHASAPPVAPSDVDKSDTQQSTAGTTDNRRSPWHWSPNSPTKGFFVSLAFHIALLVALALTIEASRSTGDGRFALELLQSDAPKLESSQHIRKDSNTRLNRLSGEAVSVNVISDDPSIDDLRRGPAANSFTAGRPDPMGLNPADLLLSDDSPRGGGLEGRGQQARSVLLPARGGTRQSEEAVERGLRWLAYHQRDDGSWHFNHHGPRCRGACRNPGTETSTTAATALALLPFLGAGYTHASDEYGEVVGRGLYYLNNRASFGPYGADLQEGTMYAQGLCGIALCEAYAMSGDANLRGLAQRTLDFIDYAQDKRGGGWRYEPGQPGDTTVTGWQLMALKSGEMAKLNVASPTIALAVHFLDGVSSEYGSRYGYMTRRPRNSTTAIGLLMRMYTGWRRNRAELVRGVSLLDKQGPSKTDMYYNYYATQVLCHYGGAEWKRWNDKLRDFLIATQSSKGHESGSWYFPDKNGDKGGRLYNTAMAVMTLEVYYRYMPLYEQQAVGEQLPDAETGNSAGRR